MGYSSNGFKQNLFFCCDEINKNMKKTKRLIETLEIQCAVPDNSSALSLENMISQWGSTPLPELSVMLVHLRYLAQVHQSHHWIAKGDQFYGDHLLFERLYNETNDEIDTVAEKAIGLGCPNNVHLQMQLKQIAKLSETYGKSMTIPQQSDLARRSFVAEVNFLRCIANCVDNLKTYKTLSRGLDNMIAGIEDLHEGHVYLLKQRVSQEL